MKWFLILALGFISCGQTNRQTTLHTNEDTNSHQRSGEDQKRDTAKQRTAPITADRLIVPGESIGKTKLGTDADSLQKLLGPPDASDAAMGKAWLTWKGKGTEHNNVTQLNIYTTYKDSTMQQKTVQQMRTTSSYFSTADGVQVGSSFKAIQQAFPSFKKRAYYKEAGKNITIYDAPEKGIAFEIDSAEKEETCTGIIIHKEGKDVTEVYLFLHPDMQLIKEGS